MAYFYEIRTADNTVLKRDGGFATQDAAKTAGREDAGKMKNRRQPDRPDVERILPGAVAARTAVTSALSGTNSCSNFFNKAAASLSGPNASAAGIFNTVNIKNLSSSVSPSIGATTTQGTGAGSQINLNPSGPFYYAIAVVNYEVTPLSIGPYNGHTFQAQQAILYHEFAHIVNAIPRDAGNQTQSNANTQTVLKYCQQQIAK